MTNIKLSALHKEFKACGSRGVKGTLSLVNDTFLNVIIQKTVQRGTEGHSRCKMTMENFVH